MFCRIIQFTECAIITTCYILSKTLHAYDYIVLQNVNRIH